VVIVDPMPARRALATTAGFGAVSPDAVADLDLFTCAVDAVGISATAATAIRAVPRGGTVCFVGLGLPEVTIPLFDVVVAERRVVGSFAYTDAVFREALDRVRDASLDVAALLGPTVPLEAAHDAFRDLASGALTDVKVLVSTEQA
jgi:threonine dehydrogenase-like Zn-dependent dehydrogenase